MPRFIVAPKPAGGGGRTLYEVIDTDPKGDAREQADRCRLGAYLDGHFAHALAATLSGAGAVLDAEVARQRDAEVF